MAFDDAQKCPYTLDATILATPDEHTQPLPTDGPIHIAIGHILPLPPVLVPFFLDNVDLALPALCKCFLYKIHNLDAPMHQLCLLTTQFLWVAVATDPSLAAQDTPNCIAIPVTPVTVDTIISSWASTCYHL